MSDLEKKKDSGISVLDTVLVGRRRGRRIFVLLWALRIAARLFLFAFKLAILVVVVVVIIRVVHLFSRRD